MPITLASGAHPRGAPVQPAIGTALAGTKHCYGLYPGGGGYTQFYYAPGCYGHDEPQLDPISSTSGSAQNVTWTLTLGKDGTVTNAAKMVDLGPTFWLGAAVKDTHSLDSEAYMEIQFYPDSTLVSGSGACGSNGSFNVSSTPGKWTVCTPTWAVDPSTFSEYAAFNHEAFASGSTTTPFVMSSGDQIQVHIFKGTQTGTPFNIAIKDVTTAKSATTIVASGGLDGTLSPAFTTNVASNYLKWGAVEGTPFSFSWEIGHANFYNFPSQPQCVPGQFNCDSYNVTKWLTTTPVKITSVIFGSSTHPSSWGVTDGQGASSEVAAYCGSYNAASYIGVSSGGSCTFPWYTYNGTAKAFESGGDFTGTTSDYGQNTQYPSTPLCVDSPHGYSIYCNHTIATTSPIP